MKSTKRQSSRTGRQEIWSAAEDGFTFQRLEERGTPWFVEHEAHPGWFAYFGSLPKARKGAAGQLVLDLKYNSWKFAA